MDMYHYRDLCLNSAKYCVAANMGMALLGCTSLRVGLIHGGVFSVSAVSWGLITKQIFHIVAPDYAQRVENRDPTVPIFVNVALATTFYALAVLTTTYVVRSSCSFFMEKTVSYGELVKLSIVDGAAFFCWAHVDFSAYYDKGLQAWELFIRFFEGHKG